MSSSEITDAMRETASSISRYINAFLPSTRDYGGLSESGVARKVLVGIACALDSAASAIEAGTATTPKSGVVHESAVRDSADAQTPSQPSRSPTQ